MLARRLVSAGRSHTARSFSRSASVSMEHVIVFNHKDREATKEWTVRRKWAGGSSGDFSGYVAEIEEQRKFQEANGGSTPADVAYEELLELLKAKYGDVETVDTPETTSLISRAQELSNRLPSGWNALEDPLPDDLREEMSAVCQGLYAELNALEASLDETFSSPQTSGDECSPAIDAAVDKFANAVEEGLDVDAADPVILPTDSLETLFPWTMQPIPEEEHAEAMLGFDAPVDIEKDAAELNEHWASFSSVKLPPGPETLLPPSERQDVKDLAKMLSEHPSVKPEEIGELLEYYKKIVTRKLPAEVPVEKQHPELTYNRVAPWTFKPPVDFPGLELANRMDEDGNYADIPSKLRDDIASELQQLEELMSNLDRKK